MIERIREPKKTVLIIGKDLIQYFFPNSGEPEQMPKPQNQISYTEFVKSKNIIDILHQISMAALRGKQKELNIYFRAALESILLHVDNTGEHDCKYQETNE